MPSAVTFSLFFLSLSPTPATAFLELNECRDAPVTTYRRGVHSVGPFVSTSDRLALRTVLALLPFVIDMCATPSSCACLLCEGRASCEGRAGITFLIKKPPLTMFVFEKNNHAPGACAGAVRCESYCSGYRNVTSCTVTGGKHSWWGSPLCPIMLGGAGCTDIDSTRQM